MTDTEYNTDAELKKIKEWPHRDVMNLLDYIEERWNWNDYVRRSWEKGSNGYVLFFELHTGGFSGNEELVGSLLKNIVLRSVCYAKWERGGHHYFSIDLKVFGYQLVSDFCKQQGITKQALYQSKHKYDWVKISPKRFMVRHKE